MPFYLYYTPTVEAEVFPEGDHRYFETTDDLLSWADKHDLDISGHEQTNLAVEEGNFEITHRDANGWTTEMIVTTDPVEE
jgi:hypothetical protein